MNISNESGGGMTELLMVMTLLIFFGISMYLIIFSGSSAMRRIEEEKNGEVEARTAISYINVRIRQFDAENAVTATTGGPGGGNAILLKNRDYDDPDLDYDTWIFWDGGYLKEVLADAGAQPEWGAANGIAMVDGFQTALEDGFITSTVIYDYNGERKSITSAVRLRGGDESGTAA